MIKTRINLDRDLANLASDAVRINGGYCPCKTERNLDTKCMCKQFRDARDRGEILVCECGLYETYEEYPVVCLCGSTRFREKFEEVARKLTLEGNIVLMPNVFIHQGDACTPEQKKELDNLHRAKIAKSDWLYVINVDGYIGESTKNEIEYANRIGKYVHYLEGKK